MAGNPGFLNPRAENGAKTDAGFDIAAKGVQPETNSQ